MANQLNVSRQTLSKWELGISTPETDKIVQISEYFNVSTDYLLKDTIEFVEPTTKRQFSPRSLIIVSTTLILIGLIIMIALWEYAYLGFIIQIVGVAIFEFLISHQPKPEHKLIRSVFYGINLWLIIFVPYILLYRRMEKFVFLLIPFKNELTQSLFMFGSYFTLCLLVIGNLCDLQK